MNETRARLVAATNELFRRHGFNGTSMKLVTDAAGAPTGSLYHHFPGGKVDLAEATVRETGAAYAELFEVLTAGIADPATAVAAFFDGAADTLVESGWIDVCPIGTVAREVASTDERLRSATADVFARWIDVLTRRLVHAGAAPDEASSLAATVVCALEGCFVVARTMRDPTIVRATGAAMARLVDALVAQ